MKLLSLLILLVSATSGTNAFGQTAIDLYSRMNDPRGIARFNTPDTSPTKAVTSHGGGDGIIGPDGIPNVAEDSGSGVITHIWSASGLAADSNVTLYLYLNDTLVIKDHYNEFFQTIRGLFRPPMDTFGNNANVWDVQIPYHNGFRISMFVTNSDYNIYYAIEWHPVQESALPWLSIKPSAIPAAQVLAETRYKSQASPWHDTNIDTIARMDTLDPQSSITIADINGPAMLECLRFIPATYDFASLDSTWLNIYWDKSPTPSVHVPLKDFFLSPVNVTQADALQLRADQDSGFISYFPMPFAHNAKVELVRTGSTPLVITSSIQYHDEPVDRNAYGYFHADFNESNPTKYHVWHPVIHTLGRGRYVGISWGVMGHPFQEFLEGNPGFKVDSDATHYIEYTGAEDYFDAAWWFSKGMFTLPFAGYTDFLDQFYRFHYMDCYEFNKSFDFEFQPGNAADIYDHFRTVGYYYKHWTPFWTDRDTLIAGELWTVAGSGYAANESLQIVLGTQNLSVITNSSGDFSISLSVPWSWTSGIYNLSVNGETAPEKYYILRSPAIRALVDTLPITLRAGDSLWVSGIGYQPGEVISFYLDSIPLHQYATANSSNEFITMLRIPYISEHSYLLVARGAVSGDATAQDLVKITRTLDFEFEDMMPPTFETPGPCYAEDVSYLWDAVWSKQIYVYFAPDIDTAVIGAAVEFQFSIAHSDTFDIAYHGSTGDSLGRYTVSLDSEILTTIDGYNSNPYSAPYSLPSGPLPLGIHYLDSGYHRVRFTCIGKSDSASDYHVEPDCIVLRPTTYMAPTPGTILAQVPVTTPLATSRSLQIFPNPLKTGMASVALTLSGTDAEFFNARVSARAFDVLGRETIAQIVGNLIDNSLSGTLMLPNATSGTYYIKLILSSPDGRSLELPTQAVVVE